MLLPLRWDRRFRLSFRLRTLPPASRIAKLEASNVACQSHLAPELADARRRTEFGIDPPVGRLTEDQPSDWPSVAEVQRYNTRVREAIDQALRDCFRLADCEETNRFNTTFLARIEWFRSVDLNAD
jgi:hypothetical protein